MPASRLYKGGADLPYDYVDLHVYPAWGPILHKRAFSPLGGPWREHPREVDYPDDLCARTVELLSRAVQIDISPELSDEQIDQMAEVVVETIERCSPSAGSGSARASPARCRRAGSAARTRRA